jgi:hypothetical protein
MAADWTIGILVVALLGCSIPIPWSQFDIINPEWQACVAFIILVPLLIYIRCGLGNGTRRELQLLCIFLAAMPLVYIIGAHMRGSDSILLQWSSLLLFGVISLLSYYRSPNWLAFGIGAHGCWDMLHHSSTLSIGGHGPRSPLPEWYNVCCCIADVGIAVYVATQLSAFAPLYHQTHKRA